LLRPAEGDGVTSLMRAAAQGDTAKIRTLVEEGEDLTARDKHGRNVLYHAFTSSEETEGESLEWQFSLCFHLQYFSTSFFP
jgi:hypothetical protein